MARYRRRYSVLGMYHIVLKATDKKIMFRDNQDRRIFLLKLFTAKEKGRFKVIAYCLMDNHVHLVLMEGERLGKSIQRFTVSYTAYYHKKYGTSGHFFSNRYHSDSIEDEPYLLSAVRYVHQNPLRAGVVMLCKDFVWSSYMSYINEYKGYSTKVDAAIVLGIFISEGTFENFHLSSDDWFLKDSRKRNRQIIERYLEEKGFSVESISKQDRNKSIKELAKEWHVSQKDLAYSFEIDRKTVYRLTR